MKFILCIIALFAIYNVATAQVCMPKTFSTNYLRILTQPVDGTYSTYEQLEGKFFYDVALNSKRVSVHFMNGSLVSDDIWLFGKGVRYTVTSNGCTKSAISGSLAPECLPAGTKPLTTPITVAGVKCTMFNVPASTPNVIERFVFTADLNNAVSHTIYQEPGFTILEQNTYTNFQQTVPAGIFNVPSVCSKAVEVAPTLA
eukprot:TRINITY_DN1204_c0_g1_i1.p1 TRINITY_DN1204_c0_g1~~TRINITY_DN1204_c0_g1_i1.p1  ORF type:complete len:200 (-),score=86.70 TRINITY_DN1204_c0_g1_i1:85-684(-)